MRCARSGHRGFVAAAALDDVDQAVEACVRHYPRWSRASPAEARVLAAYGREQLVGTWPDALDAELATVDDDLVAALDPLARRFGRPTRGQRAALTTPSSTSPPAPSAATSSPAPPPPADLDELIAVAARALLARAADD